MTSDLTYSTPVAGLVVAALWWIGWSLVAVRRAHPRSPLVAHSRRTGPTDKPSRAPTGTIPTRCGTGQCLCTGRGGVR